MDHLEPTDHLDSPADSDAVPPLPIGRLAPSPTGVLHLGNARSFLLAWLDVRRRSGVVQLRIEDIDGPRIKAGAEELALEDLAWLGLDHDGTMLRQSERLDLYASAAERLLTAGLAYPCTCTRKEVEEAASAPHEDWMDAAVYPDTCRGRFATREEARAATGRDPALRFRVDVDAVPFQDGFLGEQPGQVRGDFVIQKRDGGPAYQLAVVVDDAFTKVNEVLRGDDLLASAPRQLLLYQALGLIPPSFIHVPLVVGADGLRLAKRHGDTSLCHYRRLGVLAEEVVGYLAYLCGFRERGAKCMPSDLLEDYELKALDPEPAVAQADWFAG